jgi:ribosome-associated toxin RatA of RatAB toxin-antitoxin module
VNVTKRSIEIAADAATIFRFASTTEKWPEYLPHYRFVRILEERGPERVIEMAAWRGWIPVRWIAEQRNDATRPHIAFRHLRGWTRGMEVEWRFEPTPGGTRVEIEHRLEFLFPVAADWLGKHIVSDFFIDYVAERTLARMKVLAEAAT